MGLADKVREGVKVTIAMIVALTFTAPAQLDASNGLDMSRKQYRAILPDAYYDGLAQCETRGNWKHSTLSYTGGLGIARGTAYRWSGRSRLERYPAKYQVAVADRIAFTGWTRKKDNYYKPPVGPWGWGCLKNRPHLQRYICASKHPLVQRWKRGC